MERRDRNSAAPFSRPPISNARSFSFEPCSLALGRLSVDRVAYVQCMSHSSRHAGRWWKKKKKSGHEKQKQHVQIFSSHRDGSTAALHHIETYSVDYPSYIQHPLLFAEKIYIQTVYFLRNKSCTKGNKKTTLVPFYLGGLVIVSTIYPSAFLCLPVCVRASAP